MAKQKTIKNTKNKKYGVIEKENNLKLVPARSIVEAVFFGDLNECNKFMIEYVEKKEKAQQKKKKEEK